MKQKGKCLNLDNAFKKWYFSNFGNKDKSQIWGKFLCLWLVCFCCVNIGVLPQIVFTFNNTEIETEIERKEDIYYTVVKKESFKRNNEDIIQFELYEKYVDLPIVNSLLSKKVPLKFEMKSIDFDNSIGLNNTSLCTDVNILTIKIPMTRIVDRDMLGKQLKKEIQQCLIDTDLYITVDETPLVLEIIITKFESISGTFTEVDIDKYIEIVNKSLKEV